MCGRYTVTAGMEALLKRFRVEHPEFELRPRYNVAPTQEAPVILTRDGARKLELFRWGLVPSWAKDTKIGNQMINARSETAAEKPSFRAALAKRRCLVLADGFYEWKPVAPGLKWPMRIVLASREPFAFAGLWDEWRGPDGKPLRTFTIMTTEAPQSLREIHERVPVILNPEHEDLWLNPKADGKRVANVLIPPADDALEAYSVSPLVNSPKADEPDCIEPAPTGTSKPPPAKKPRRKPANSDAQPSLL